MKAAIIGATGYGGAELIRILHQHQHIQQYTLYSSSQAGDRISKSYPQFTGISQQNLQEINIEKISSEADVVFMATPSGISAEITPQLINNNKMVIDLSGDFRFKDPDIYEKWYKQKPASKAVLHKAVYGLTELNRRNIKDAQLIANPGCYPTAAILGLNPLLKHYEVDTEAIIIDAASAASGAGRKASIGTSFCEINDNFRIYKVNEHQHIPEIEQTLKLTNSKLGPIKFNTHLIPMSRGIMATIYCKPMSKISEKELHSIYKEEYKSDPFIRIRPLGTYPATKEVYGSNYCDIGVTFDERTGWITIVSVIDNLVKGAAGQAIQNLNVMLGIDEGTGLYSPPIFP